MPHRFPAAEGLHKLWAANPGCSRLLAVLFRAAEHVFTLEEAA